MGIDRDVPAYPALIALTSIASQCSPGSLLLRALYPLASPCSFTPTTCPRFRAEGCRFNRTMQAMTARNVSVQIFFQTIISPRKKSSETCKHPKLDPHTRMRCLKKRLASICGANFQTEFKESSRRALRGLEDVSVAGTSSLSCWTWSTDVWLRASLEWRFMGWGGI